MQVTVADSFAIASSWSNSFAFLISLIFIFIKSNKKSDFKNCYMCAISYMYGFPGGSVVRSCLPMQETQVQSLGQEGPLEMEMTAHSIILAWENPWTEEPVGL